MSNYKYLLNQYNFFNIFFYTYQRWSCSSSSINNPYLVQGSILPLHSRTFFIRVVFFKSGGVHDSYTFPCRLSGVRHGLKVVDMAVLSENPDPPSFRIFVIKKTSYLHKKVDLNWPKLPNLQFNYKLPRGPYMY